MASDHTVTPDCSQQQEHDPTQSSLPTQPPNTGTDEVSKNAAGSSRVPRKSTQPWSEVWNHFIRFTADGGQIRGRCNYCKKEFAADPKMNGTSTLKYHMRVCKKFPRVSNTGHSSGGTQAELVLGTEGEGSISSWKFNQEAVRKSVAEMIIIDELPFRFVEAKGFRHCMSIACPGFRVPSRWTIARDCYQFYSDLKIELKKVIASQTSRVCLTTDSWTSIQRENYMCLTAHFVDNNWKLNKKILNFVQ